MKNEKEIQKNGIGHQFARLTAFIRISEQTQSTIPFY
jgi:hypothetical protein